LGTIVVNEDFSPSLGRKKQASSNDFDDLKLRFYAVLTNKFCQQQQIMVRFNTFT
jgi:hypothetical protein